MFLFSFSFIFPTYSRDKLFRNTLLFNKRKALQTERIQHLVADLTVEKEAWLTRDNLKEKITEDLFRGSAATTGFVAPETSQHWRHSVVTFHLNRVFTTEMMDELNPDQPEGLLAIAKQEQSHKTSMVREFLEGMIGSGAERANYKQLVKEFSLHFEKGDVLAEEEEELMVRKKHMLQVFVMLVYVVLVSKKICCLFGWCCRSST